MSRVEKLIQFVEHVIQGEKKCLGVCRGVVRRRDCGHGCLLALVGARGRGTVRLSKKQGIVVKCIPLWEDRGFVGAVIVSDRRMTPMSIIVVVVFGMWGRCGHRNLCKNVP